MYYLFRKLNHKTILRGMVATPEEVKNHFLKEKSGFAEDDEGNVYHTIEELENAESIRPEPRVEYDSFFTGRTEISEDTDRELSETDTDTTE